MCPRGIDSTITIQTMVLGSGGDIFVGGSFESRVWDGKHFVQVFHVAHFDGKYTDYDHCELNINLNLFFSPRSKSRMAAIVGRKP